MSDSDEQELYWHPSAEQGEPRLAYGGDFLLEGGEQLEVWHQGRWWVGHVHTVELSPGSGLALSPHQLRGSPGLIPLIPGVRVRNVVSPPSPGLQAIRLHEALRQARATALAQRTRPTEAEDATVHTLVVSSNRGRYALDHPLDGPDLTGGSVIALLLGGHWITGSIEHAGGLYADEGASRALRGYYFTDGEGGICGLCAGMKVRTL